MKSLQRLWRFLTVPQAQDEDDARQEYMTRVLLVMMAAVLYLCTIPILIGWISGFFDFYPVAIMLFMDIPIGLGWLLAHLGHWRSASFILPGVIYVQGIYSALVPEQSNISLLFFILTILLVSVLQSVKVQWITVLLCVGANFIIRWMVYQWSLEDIVPNLITLGGFFSGITLLQNFFGGQMRRALELSRRLNDSLRAEITEREKIEEALRMSEQHLEFLATHDPLTSLPNRILLQDRLSHAISFAKRNGRLTAVLYLDLDGFKSVNDLLGHEKGDQLLKELAGRLEGCLRQSDTVARIGGDEFAFVCVLENSLGREFASSLCERIIKTVSLPFTLDGHIVNVTTSIGVSLAPQDGDHLEVLLRKADTAMFRAKSLGKNGYQFFTEPVWKTPPLSGNSRPVSG